MWVFCVCVYRTTLARPEPATFAVVISLRNLSRQQPLTTAGGPFYYSNKTKGLGIMSLLTCPECSHNVSSHARRCPSCGTGLIPESEQPLTFKEWVWAGVGACVLILVFQFIMNLG
jgi:hypothetical protein